MGSCLSSNLDSIPKGNEDETTEEKEKTDISKYDDEITSQYEQIKIDFNWYYTTVSQTLLVNLKQITKTKNELDIIDIGCGDGNISRLIIDEAAYLNKNRINMIGIDVSSSQIDLAKKKSTSNDKYMNTIQYETGSAENIKYKNKFDVAICLWPFGYSNNIDMLSKMIKSCFESLKNDGICIGITITMQNPNLLKKYRDVHKNKFNLEFGDDSIDKIIDGDLLIQKLPNAQFVEYFFYPDTYNKIAKEHGFKDGIQFIDPKKWNYNKLNDNEQKMAKEFFTNPHPFSMFILRK